MMTRITVETNEWKDIPLYEGIYQINTNGDIKSLISNKILSGGINGSGYRYVRLTKNGQIKNKSVHRLVAETFIPNPNKLPQVNHKDENKLNNCVDNLEWRTAKYNRNYSTINERLSKITSKIVYQFDKTNNLINTFQNSKEIQNKLGFDRTVINDCCNNKINEAYGYIWSYTPTPKKYVTSKTGPRRVFQYDMNDNLIMAYKSAYAAQKVTNIDRGTILHCCKGDITSINGFKWKQERFDE